jgi:SAM-dependent methyltransferase
MPRMLATTASTRSRARRFAAHERWLAGVHPRALAHRWVMGEQGQLLANGPALRLPISLKLNANARILDIGCGRGALLRAFDGQLRLKTAPVGVDLSRTMLRRARRDEGRDGRTRLAQATADALPFRDGAFTLVTCGYVVRHLENDEVDALLAEIHRVLAPGGLAVIWDFGPSGNARLDAWNARVVSVAGVTPHLRSGATLRHRAAAAGFTFNREADLRPFLVPPIARASILVGRPPEGWTGPLG